jgi:hypothetical protein
LSKSFSHDLPRLGKENFIVWCEKFETVAMQYGDAGISWKKETLMVFSLPKIDDAKYDSVNEELKEKMFLGDYDKHEKRVMEYMRS